MGAYYNENNPFTAAWLRNLISAGHIASGEVDERSIEDVRPDDLKGFTQCHFFAGIGVWSYALRSAGWPDDRPVWTGSCPCQPFSAAGKRKGITDERHLWPSWFHLIREHRPLTIFGEQVASKDGLAWLDLVSADLEGTNYVIGSIDLCAAGFGAPHIRQRLYFVANSSDSRRAEAREHDGGSSSFSSRSSECGGTSDVADTDGRLSGDDGIQRSREHGQQPENGSADSNELGDARYRRRPSWSARSLNEQEASIGERSISSGARDILEYATSEQVGLSGRTRESRATNGFWRDADWLPCVDGKTRPVEPGSFPLVNGSPQRLGRLRGYGNALVAPQATAFVEAYLEVKRED